jgi:hypothetical protein
MTHQRPWLAVGVCEIACFTKAARRRSEGHREARSIGPVVARHPALPILAGLNFGRTSPPRWQHLVQKNLGSMSESLASSPQQSALISM